MRLAHVGLHLNTGHVVELWSRPILWYSTCIFGFTRNEAPSQAVHTDNYTSVPFCEWGRFCAKVFCTRQIDGRTLWGPTTSTRTDGGGKCLRRDRYHANERPRRTIVSERPAGQQRSRQPRRGCSAAWKLGRAGSQGVASLLTHTGTTAHMLQCAYSGRLVAVDDEIETIVLQLVDVIVRRLVGLGNWNVSYLIHLVSRRASTVAVVCRRPDFSGCHIVTKCVVGLPEDRVTW